MILSDLASGDSAFLDANIFVYYFQPHATLASSCDELFDRIGRVEINGYTSTHVLSEMAHRLMMFEAATAYGWGPNKIKARLKQAPSSLGKLVRFRQALELVLRSRIQIIAITPDLVLSAAIISQQTGLLSNDALIVAAMQANGLNKLAGNDADFDRVPGLTRYGPT